MIISLKIQKEGLAKNYRPLLFRMHKIIGFDVPILNLSTKER